MAPSNMALSKCPTCRGPVPSREENRSFPFCSESCRAVDLGRWFTGSYRVPGPPAPDAVPASREDDEEEGGS